MVNIAVIPARSGSKGLQDKNIMPFLGKPLMTHTIDAALESDLFDRVLVSTDSEEYARIARESGAFIPSLRSPGLSGDETGSWDVVREAVSWVEHDESQGIIDTVCLLQPTSPARTAQDIVNAYTLYADKAAQCIVSVCEEDHPIEWSRHLGADGEMTAFANPESMMRRQDLPPSCRVNGAIYILARDRLDETENLYASNCYGYRMPKERSIDIDDIYDFVAAEAICLRLRSQCSWEG